MSNTTKNIYEIYTKNPETGETGWEIKFVLASPSTIKSFPNFDCIITVNDCPAGVEVINYI